MEEREYENEDYRYREGVGCNGSNSVLTRGQENPPPTFWGKSA